MLFDTEIAEVTDALLPAALVPEALMALRGLVYRSREYKENRGYYGDVYVKLKEVAASALDVAATAEQKAEGRVLGAIINKLKILPNIAVESFGTDKSKSTLTTDDNWEELARDVLSALYLPPGSSGQRDFIVATRAMPLDCFGSWPRDEAYYALRGWYV